MTFVSGNVKVNGLNPVQSLKRFSGHFASSVMAAFAFASFILSFFRSSFSFEAAKTREEQSFHRGQSSTNNNTRSNYGTKI